MPPNSSKSTVRLCAVTVVSTIVLSCSNGPQRRHRDIQRGGGAAIASPRPASPRPDSAQPASTQPAEHGQAGSNSPVDLGPTKRAAAAVVDRAVTDAGARVVGWWHPLAAQPTYRELLDPDRHLDVALSLGTVGSGKLQNGTKLPVEGPHYSVIERHRRRHTQWGSPELVELIKYAAKRVAKAAPGADLRLGNLSRHAGGDIRWSSSHNSGRDADLAFYCKRREDGRSVPAPDLVEFDAHGQGIDRKGLVFDTARNWQLVVALLTNKDVGVQWIFVSKGLKRLLLSYGRNHGADKQLVARARKVLHQPTDAPPHNDHLHLRVTCPKVDRLEGCLDFGPRWQWVDWHRRALLARTLALAPALGAPEPTTRLKALDFLGRIRSPYAPEVALNAALDEPDVSVRQRELEIAADIPHWTAGAVLAARHFVSEPQFSVDQKALAYRVLRRSVDPLAPDAIAHRIANTALTVGERRLAARALVHFMNPGLVPFLIEQIGLQPAAVAAELAVTLRRITNRSQDFEWETSSKTAQRNAQADWQAWWDAHRSMSRKMWVSAGFRARGLTDETTHDVAGVGALIGLLTDTPDYIAYNANLRLKELTDRWAPLEAWSYQRLSDYWTRWWNTNRSDLRARR